MRVQLSTCAGYAGDNDAGKVRWNERIHRAALELYLGYSHQGCRRRRMIQIDCDRLTLCNEGLAMPVGLPGGKGCSGHDTECRYTPELASVRAKEGNMTVRGAAQVTFHDVSTLRRRVYPSHLEVFSDRAHPVEASCFRSGAPNGLLGRIERGQEVI